MQRGSHTLTGQFVGIKVKASKGRQSDNQKEFQRQLEAAGGMYVLAYSIEDVITQIGGLNTSLFNTLMRCAALVVVKWSRTENDELVRELFHCEVANCVSVAVK